MKILGVHGIGQTFVGPEMLKQHWLPALRDGIHQVDGPPISDSDLQILAFGSLFRPEDVRTAGAGKIEAGDLNAWEEAVVAEWWREAAKLSAEASGSTSDESPDIQPPDFQGRARTPQAVQRGLRQLSKSRFFRALGPERILLFGLRQVRLFLHDAKLRNTILEKVCDIVSPETRVIIAHSLGSVVAYEALCANPAWKIDTFITFGSPLGIRNLIFDVLTPKPENDRGVWPNVRRWVNIADQGDIVALEKRLAPLFGAVEDSTSYNGWKAHDATRYLTTRTVGEAVTTGLSNRS